jgi:hypothetical protein
MQLVCLNVGGTATHVLLMRCVIGAWCTSSGIVVSRLPSPYYSIMRQPERCCLKCVKTLITLYFAAGLAEDAISRSEGCVEYFLTA